MIRNIALGVMAIGVIVMILIGEYWISIAFPLFLLADVLSNNNRANHNYVKMDYDDDDGAGIDIENSPHTQDLLGGYYIGGGLEYLLTENIGATFGIRLYNFASYEQFGESVTSENRGTFSDYKYDNDLTQVQYGLAYYFR